MIDPVSVLESFRQTAASSPDRPSLIYFDTVLTAREVDRATDALAAALADKGFAAGDRVALFLQNVPQYVIGLIAAWKLGGIAVPINPMLTPREVSKLLADATPTVLVTLNELHSAGTSPPARMPTVTGSTSMKATSCLASRRCFHVTGLTGHIACALVSGDRWCCHTAST